MICVINLTEGCNITHEFASILIVVKCMFEAKPGFSLVFKYVYYYELSTASLQSSTGGLQY
jgi:hypothetical protein